MSSCANNGQVNDAFDDWLNKTYGGLVKVKSTHGKLHDYLGMLFDFSVQGQVTVDMTKYIGSMVDECSVPFGKDNVAPTTAGENLLTINPDSPPLSRECREEFHTIVAKGLFVCRHARLDLHPTIAVLAHLCRAQLRTIGPS